MITNATTVQSEALHITEDMVNGLIKKVEDSILNLTTTMEQKLPDLKEAESIYFPIKQEYDRLEESLKKEKQTLSALIGFRQNKNDRKDIRVYHSKSNVDQDIIQKGKRRKPYPYTDAAVAILTTEQMFLNPEILVQKIFNANPAWKILFQNGREKWEKGKVKNNFIKSADVNSKKYKLVFVNDKLGLREWLDSNKKPLPQYLKSFIYSNGAEQEAFA